MFSQQHRPRPPPYATPTRTPWARTLDESEGTMVVMTESDWRCRDCGVDTDSIDEYYMVDDRVWEQAAMAWTVTSASDVLNSDSAALSIRATSPIAPSTPPAGCGAAHD